MSKVVPIKKKATPVAAPVKAKKTAGSKTFTTPADAKIAALIETPAPVKAEVVPKEKAAKTPKEKVASKFVSLDTFKIAGVDTRLRVSEYQDYTFSINGAKDRRLSDAALADDWRAQFPNAVAFNEFHVKGARRDYNVGTHSKMFAGRKSGDAVAVEFGPDKTPVTAAPKVKMKASAG